MLNGRRVAIIGATGFIGSHLTERVLAQGASALALARSDRHLENLSAVRGDCQFEVCDVTALPQLERSLEAFRPDTVFHLAARRDDTESFAQMADCLRVNTQGVINTLEAATRAGVELFVYGDSCKTYGNGGVPYRETQGVQPVCSYAIAKAAAWHFCMLAASLGGPQVVGLRPTFVYGPRQNQNVVRYTGECAERGIPVRLCGGAQTRDPLYVHDAVRAFVQAAISPRACGHSIPIGGGCEIAVTDLCRTVLDVLGSSAEVQPVAEEARLTEIWHSHSDNLEAGQLLDWCPRVTLAAGLALTFGK